MSFGGSTSQDSLPKFKSFVSEAEIEEKKKKRQEEWEKVRNAEDPVEAPEEDYDPRSLYDRLQEQKMKKQAEFEEAHKLKNMIRGLDDDEVTFLEFVDMRKQEIESQRLKEDMQEIEEYRKAVATVSEEAIDAKRQELKKIIPGSQTTVTGKRSQLALLSGAVKRKSVNSTNSAITKKQKNGTASLDPMPEDADKKDTDARHSISESDINGGGDSGAQDRRVHSATATVLHAPTALQCAGILPGLGVYTDSSDSENSSSTDDGEPKFDLVGRRRTQAQQLPEPKAP
uniref:Putative nefa-interacting nuclear protein nip30 n=1 Tax=Ornithodoros turicata TaxID=34597 RepID=A0A2R5LLP8_9ACAR